MVLLKGTLVWQRKFIVRMRRTSAAFETKFDMAA